MARIKTAKAAKKLMKLMNRLSEDEIRQKFPSAEDRKKKEEEDNARIAILFDPNLSCIEKCNIVYKGGLPSMPANESNIEVTNIRKEALALYAYFFIEFGTLLGKDETVNSNEYCAYIKIRGDDIDVLDPARLLIRSLFLEKCDEKKARTLLMNIKLEVANGLDKLSTFLEAVLRGDYEHKEGVDDELIHFEGFDYVRSTFRLRLRTKMRASATFPGKTGKAK